MVNLSDSVAAPEPVDPDRARRRFLPATSALTLGVIRARGNRFMLGPLTLIALGEPEATAGGVRWPVTGGLLTRVPGGHVGFRWEAGRLTGYLTGWQPALPSPLYRLTQLPVHTAVTRLFLLELRGRDPLPGPEAGHGERRAAAAIDAGLLLLGSRLIGPRHVVARAAALAAVYHPACWILWGRTAGAAALGLRLLSVDGSRPAPAQALVRLLLAPLRLAGRRVDERRSGTAVIRR